jgi:predicted transcriptional regulator
MREDGHSIGNDELKYVIEALVAKGALTYRKDGQKYLYGYQSDFFANDVKPWTPNV